MQIGEEVLRRRQIVEGAVGPGEIKRSLKARTKAAEGVFANDRIVDKKIEIAAAKKIGVIGSVSEVVAERIGLRVEGEASVTDRHGRSHIIAAE